MILIDTGPLVALVDDGDAYHRECARILRGLGTDALLTTMPCFGEAMYFLQRSGGYYLQDRLWDMRRRGRLGIHASTDAEIDRMDVLMGRYQNFPMDFADASLVATAESLSLAQVFTLDSDFYSYVLDDGSTLQVLGIGGGVG